MIRAGIIGASGYTGGELIRVLLNHPDVEIAFAHSKNHAGKRICEVHTDLLGETADRFSDGFSAADVIFLCVGHGEAKLLLGEFPELLESKIIDLSQDHRIGSFVYGLPELNRERIANARHVANPGCFATAIQLALLPLAKSASLGAEIHINATTGSTGAGQSLAASSHFSWRANNMSIYKAFEHQHLAEIRQSILQLQPGFEQAINFIPQRGAFTRGIFGSLYLESPLSYEALAELYNNYYHGQAFVHVSGREIDLKQVVNTNRCLLSLHKHGDKLQVNFCIDNLLKGASGQAVQNMNLMFGLEETKGLKLKANYF